MDIKVGSIWRHINGDFFVTVINAEVKIEFKHTDGRVEILELDVFLANYELIDPYDKPIEPSRKHGHYFKDVSKLSDIDVYAVCEVFKVKDCSGAKQHALKKILCSGYRGVKDEIQDLQEAVDTLTRLIELKRELGGDNG